MKRFWLFAALGVVAVLAVLAALYVVGEPPSQQTAKVTPGDGAVRGEQQAAAPVAQTPAVPDTGERTPPPIGTRSLPPARSGGQTAVPGGDPVAPSFDIVRVAPSGDAVIAGRAAPNSRVTVTDGDTALGTVDANSRGEWVLVPDRLLKPGSRQIGVQATTEDGKTALSDKLVVIVVPERGKDIAGRPTDQPTGALALAVPRDGGGPSQILQQPPPMVIDRPARKAAGVPAPSPLRPAASKSATPSGGPRQTASVPPGPPPPRGTASVAAGPSSAPRQLAAVAPGSGIADSTTGRLTMQSIDYDESGSFAVSGQAAPGATVQVYLDNTLVGRALADQGGTWRLKPEDSVEPGLYTMRVDQVDTEGKVLARVETRFSRAGLIGDLPRDMLVFVQPGQSLWRIARHTLGHGIQYTVIFDANRDQIRNPDLIYPGQVFLVPQVN